MDFSIASDKFNEFSDSLTANLPNILLALMAILASILLAKYVRKFVARVSHKISNNKAVINLFALVAYLAVIFVGFAIALTILNLDSAATSLLAGAGILGIALGFAFQEIASNFIAGITLSLQKPFRIGDLVETNGTYGHIKHINLRSTEIETLQGQMVHIPNKDILLNPMTDYSYKRSRRVDIEVGVTYDTDLQFAQKVTLKAVSKIQSCDNQKPVDLYYTEFGDSSINFTVRFWHDFKQETDFLDARSQAIIAIRRAFKVNNITIPFPIRTLDVPQKIINKLG